MNRYRIQFSLLAGILFLLISSMAAGVELAPDIAVDPPSKDFGEQPPWAYVSQTFTLSNEGSDTLNVTDVHVSGPDREMFPIYLNNDPFILAPGETHEIVIKFSPTSTGQKSAWLRLECNDPDESVFEVDMTGYCIAAEIEVEPESYDFGEVLVGQYTDKTFTLTNTGDIDLEMPIIELIGYETDGYSIISGAPDANIISTGTHEVVVRFAPQRAGESESTLHMYSNDPDEAIYDAALTGVGIAPKIELTVTSKDFGDHFVGDSLSKCIGVNNIGNANLVITELDIAGTDAAMFRLDPVVLPKTIEPGEGLELCITFKPSSDGEKEATLWIDHNDTDERGMEVPLTGTGMSNPPDIDLDTEERDFDEIAVGDSTSRNVTVYNRGQGDLYVSEVKLLHEDADQFRIVEGGGTFTLEPEESRLVTIRFLPTTPGSKMTHLKFYSNDPDENPILATLEG